MEGKIGYPKDAIGRRRLVAKTTLAIIGVANVLFVLMLFIGTTPERRQPLAVCASTFLNLGVTVLVFWAAKLAGAGKFALAISLLVILSCGHIGMPAVAWLAGFHEGGRLIVAAQVSYACMLFAACITVICCARTTSRSRAARV